MALKLRLARQAQADADIIADLEQACFNDPWSKDAVEQVLCSNKLPALFFIAEEDGLPAGYIGALMILPYECQVLNLAVYPGCRRRGVATALLKELETACGQWRISDMTLEVRASNTGAQALYKGFGFAAEGIRKNYYEGKEDALIMWKRGIPAVEPFEQGHY